MLTAYGFLNLLFLYGVGILLVWLAIYTAVRAALGAHRKALAREMNAGPDGRLPAQ